MGEDYARSPTHRSCIVWTDALKVIGDAFDAAWVEIAGWFGTDPLVIEAARLRLADAVLSVASEHRHEVEALKRAALQRMGQFHQTTSRRQRQHGVPQGGADSQANRKMACGR